MSENETLTHWECSCGTIHDIDQKRCRHCGDNAPQVSTPRTNAVAYVYSMDPNENEVVPAGDMRQLETELISVTAERDRLLKQYEIDGNALYEARKARDERFTVEEIQDALFDWLRRCDAKIGTLCEKPQPNFLDILATWRERNNKQALESKP